MKLKTGIFASASMMVFAAAAFTTASAPQNGVYRFTFGVSETQDGSIPVPASAVCDVNGTMEEGQFSYGFLGTTDESYKNDVPSSLPTVPHAIDGFKVVKGQKIVLHDTTDANGVSCVAGPAASEYLPRGVSSFEGRYPVRFSMRAEERAYYAVTCTVANASATANADVNNLTVNGGSVTMPVGIAPKTLTMSEGAKIIVPGDSSWTAGTVVNLFSYTMLSGVDSATLSRQVVVTGLAPGLREKVLVSDGTVIVRIENASGMALILV